LKANYFKKYLAIIRIGAQVNDTPAERKWSKVGGVSGNIFAHQNKTDVLSGVKPKDLESLSSVRSMPEKNQTTRRKRKKALESRGRRLSSNFGNEKTGNLTDGGTPKLPGTGITGFLIRAKTLGKC